MRVLRRPVEIATEVGHSQTGFWTGTFDPIETLVFDESDHAITHRVKDPIIHASNNSPGVGRALAH